MQHVRLGPSRIKVKEAIITPSDDSWQCAHTTMITHISCQRWMDRLQSNVSLEAIYNSEQRDTEVLFTFICMRCTGNNCISNLGCCCCVCVCLCVPIKTKEFSMRTCVCRGVLFETSTQQASSCCGPNAAALSDRRNVI